MNIVQYHISLQATALLLGISATLACLTEAQAQPIYRIVDANGRVTFSDKPPTSPDKGAVSDAEISTSAAGASAGFPFELRQAASRFPVTLYASSQCAPCDAGRALLINRGIPFSERSVSTLQDVKALEQLSGENSLPFLTIGSQRIKGLSDLEWAQYLDAAGYPKKSQLPPGYKHPAPTPLVSVHSPDLTPKPGQEPEASRYKPPPAADPNNPAGILF